MAALPVGRVASALQRVRSLGRFRVVRWPLLGGAYVALVLIVQPKLWDGVHFLGWDAVRQAWADLVFGARSFLGGELPLWNPFEKAGYAFIGDPEASPLYPLHWVIYGLVALFDDGYWLVLCRALLHYAIAGVGMHLYLKRLSLRPAARWTGTTAYLLCSRMAKAKDQAPLGTVAWFPWMVIAVEEATERPSWRSGALLGAVFGVDLLAGYPPNYFRNLVALVCLFSLALVGQLRRRRGRQRAYLRELAKALGLGMVITVGLCVPTLVMLAGFEGTARAQMSLAEVLRSAMGPADALQLLAPGLRQPHRFLVYVGLAPVLLAGVAVAARPTARRLMHAALAAGFFLMACGGNAFVLPVLVRTIPLFALWRVPEQYLYISVFFLAVLGAEGMSDLLAAGADEARRLRRVALGMGAIGLISAAASVVVTRAAGRPDPKLVDAADISLVIAAITAGLLVALGTPRTRHRRIAGWLVAVLLLFDLGLQVRPIYDIVAPAPDLRREQRILPQLRGIERRARLADEGFFGYRVASRNGVRDLYGRRTALISRRFFVYDRHARASYPLLAAANVRYVAGRHAGQVAHQAGARARRGPGGVVELTQHAPFAYWSGQPKVLGSAEHVLREMAHAAHPERQALLERGDLTAAERTKLAKVAGQTPIRPAKTIAYKRNSLSLEIDAPAGGVLVVNDAYDGGWRVRVDGRPARLHRANYLFRAVILSPGRHAVAMRYAPRGLRPALWIYALTALTLVGLAALALWLRRT